ncbi:MAG: CoA-binding protein [Actinomycetota bacterium]
MAQQETIERILGYTRRIAVVGLSPRPHRPSHAVSQRLRDQGYEVVPVNPAAEGVFGLRSYPSLREVPGQVDLVAAFRRPKYLKDVARQAVAIGARAFWMQSGLWSDEATAIAEAAGLDVVDDRCLAVEVDCFASRRLAGAGAR